MAIAIWIASLWLTEIIPLVVTAFLPLLLFPLFGILSSKAVAAAYMDNTIFLFIAGMLMALALERWDLHRRFSFKILSWCGAKPSNLLLGMMGATFFLSMFVSNTATALIMVPNAISVCESIERQTLPQFRHESKAFGMAVMLGIAYAANVGGMASLIGTPPNLVFQAQLGVLFPDAPEVTFADWLGFGLPIGLAIMVMTWAYLRFIYLRNFKGAVADRQMFINQYEALGAWSQEQITVAILFTTLAILWIFRGDLNFSSITIKGWANLFPEPKFINDATIGMAFAVMMLLIPARPSMLPEASPDADTKRSTTLLNWETANQMPYDIVFLFGGGFALAAGFLESGLSAYLGEQLGSMDVPLAAQLFVCVFFMIWLTELTSNTATSNIMIPIAASIAVGSGVSPYTFMIPAALACSCAFCLPVATPPNMVVFASGRLPMSEMIRAGVFLNVVCSVLILGLAFTLIPAVLKVDADELPAWAETGKI
mmetsp:Transcript_14840/g.30283  ORF Transcript_14840/g.30283 Transcript_14840/m.30283 type:complete len:484 (+) Transcript_14840:658-2109(+)